jgi:hypothetical protein
MAIVKYEIKSENRTEDLDIHNWRLAKNSIAYWGSGAGWETCQATILLLKENNFMIWLTRSQILELDKMPRDHVESVVNFSTAGGVHPGFCGICRGAGKIDWVQKTMGITRVGLGQYYSKEMSRNCQRFERDIDHFLLYQVAKGHLTSNIIFARTTLNPAEFYCPECSGTGIALDGRYTIFDGMPGIRKKLVLIERNLYKGKD